jgi:anaphase-promoting complex subunit 3
MSGGSSPVLKLLVEKYLSAGLIDTALFYAERLFYENASPENLYTFANCYFRKGKINQAYLLLHPREHWTTSSENTYLFALCCVELDKLYEAHQALQPNIRFSEDITPTLEAVSETAGHAAGVYLLGKICRLQHRKEDAVNYYKLSLQVNYTHYTIISPFSPIILLFLSLSSDGSLSVVLHH